MAKWLELMRTGVFKDRHKKDRTVSQENLDAIAKNYLAEKTQSPIIVGHPDKEKVPSFGIIDQLKVVGNKLLFLPGRVVPEFSALVRQGGFPDVSAGLNAAMDRLTHVAFLSAERPAIDGLTPVCEFSCNVTDDKIGLDVTDVIKGELPEFSSSAESWLSWRINSIGTMFRNMKNWLIEKEGQEKADTMMPEYSLEDLSKDLPAPVVQSPEFSSAALDTLEAELATKTASVVELTKMNETLSGQVAEFSASVQTVTTELSRVKDENSSMLVKIADYEKSIRAAEFSAFVEEQITAGKILPDQKTTTLEMLETMHAATPVEFSSESGLLSPVEQYKKELSARPVIVPSAGETHNPEFSAGGDLGAVEIGNKARAYIDEQAAKGVTVDVLSAIKHVKGN